MNKPNKDINDMEYSLKALRLIEENSAPTQRELSKNLNLSLGKINYILKSLTEKGLIKIKRFKNSNNKRAYLYYLTKEGFEQKTIIANNFLRRKIEEYEFLKQEIEMLKKEIRS